MTDSPPETSPDVPPDRSPDPQRDAPLADRTSVRDAKRIAAWIGLGVSILVGVIALFRFYAHASETIVALVPAEYVDPFLAGFNLALVLVAAAGALVLVRTLRETEPDD